MAGNLRALGSASRAIAFESASGRHMNVPKAASRVSIWGDSPNRRRVCRGVRTVSLELSSPAAGRSSLVVRDRRGRSRHDCRECDHKACSWVFGCFLHMRSSGANPLDQRGVSSLASLAETVPLEKCLIALDFSSFPEFLQLRPVQLFDAVSVFFCEQIRFATIFTAPYNVPCCR